MAPTDPLVSSDVGTGSPASKLAGGGAVPAFAGDERGGARLSLPAQAARVEVVAAIQGAVAQARADVALLLADRPSDGLSAAHLMAGRMDAIVRAAHAWVTETLYPSGNRTQGEQLALLAVGGYGRGELAPFSDVDLAFVTPISPGGWAEQRIKALLYLLWDAKLDIGHSVRSVPETIAAARRDMTVRTALLEARPLAGDGDLSARALAEVRGLFIDPGPFVLAKLEERAARHAKAGEGRYVTQPDVKEGKGTLRDLHALIWIAKGAFGAATGDDLVAQGLFTAPEIARFRRAERFFWAVRCHLHLEAARRHERLTFGLQRQIATRMRFRAAPGRQPAERFMQLFFRHAKAAGDLSGAFFTQLDERFAPKGFRFGLPAFRRRPRRLDGFVLDRGRIALPRPGFLAEHPPRLVELFSLAAREGLEVHHAALREAGRSARLIDARLRATPEANRHFLDLLTAKGDREPALRWMNEAGVLGRFLPDFGRIVGLSQFDMYHQFTVDEHTIRMLGLLGRVARGEAGPEHKLGAALHRQIASDRALAAAVLFHDIAKGRGGDHSELGAEVASRVGPRLGLDPGEVELAAWLVRHHLLMSRTAFKRDLADPQTIDDFVAVVRSPERLRLLYILTSVDIDAVGPGAWTAWKRSLITQLHDAAEERLRLGHKQRGRDAAIAAAKAAAAAALGWTGARLSAVGGTLPPSYWLAEPAAVQTANLAQLAEGVAARAGDDRERGGTLLTVIAADRPGLFRDVALAITAHGGDIRDARIHTGRDGRALDNLLVHDARGGPWEQGPSLARLVAGVEAAAGGEQSWPRGAPAFALSAEIAAFRIRPLALVDNGASRQFTVVEVNAADRPGLLVDLLGVFVRAGTQVHSAHIATWGERAVDVFYVTGADGRKLSPEAAGPLADMLKAAAEKVTAPV